MSFLLTHLLGRTRSLSPLPCRAAAADVAPDDDPPLGCGWFDSSHELQHGLWVREHATPDEVANDLPLALWLELHLANDSARPAV